MNEWRQHTGGLAWPTLGLVALLAVCTAGLQLAGWLGWLPLWAVTPALIGVAYLWFTPLHEAVHGNIGGSRRLAWIDGAVGWLSSLAFVAPYPAFKAVHLQHHGTVNQPRHDPDLWVRGSHPVALAARCLTVVPHYYWRFVSELSGRSAAGRAALRHAAVAVIGIGGLCTALVATGHWIELLALWIVPGWLASGLLALAFDWLPHHPHHGTGRFDNARILDGGPLLAVLMVGQDAHLVHHLWPRVPFYRYHRVLAATRGELIARGVRFAQLRPGRASGAAVDRS